MFSVSCWDLSTRKGPITADTRSRGGSLDHDPARLTEESRAFNTTLFMWRHVVLYSIPCCALQPHSIYVETRGAPLDSVLCFTTPLCLCGDTLWCTRLRAVLYNPLYLCGDAWCSTRLRAVLHYTHMFSPCSLRVLSDFCTCSVRSQKRAVGV